MGTEKGMACRGSISTLEEHKDISDDDKDRPIREPENKNAQAAADAQSVTAG